MGLLTPLFISFCQLYWMEHCSSYVDTAAYEVSVASHREKIKEKIAYWKRRDDEAEEANRKQDEEYQKAVDAFYRGELPHYPGMKGPVGIPGLWTRSLLKTPMSYHDRNFNKLMYYWLYDDGTVTRPEL